MEGADGASLRSSACSSLRSSAQSRSSHSQLPCLDIMENNGGYPSSNSSVNKSSVTIYGSLSEHNVFAGGSFPGISSTPSKQAIEVDRSDIGASVQKCWRASPFRLDSDDTASDDAFQTHPGAFSSDEDVAETSPQSIDDVPIGKGHVEFGSHIEDETIHVAQSKVQPAIHLKARSISDVSCRSDGDTHDEMGSDSDGNVFVGQHGEENTKGSTGLAEECTDTLAPSTEIDTSQVLESILECTSQDENSSEAHHAPYASDDQCCTLEEVSEGKIDDFTDLLPDGLTEVLAESTSGMDSSESLGGNPKTRTEILQDSLQHESETRGLMAAEEDVKQLETTDVQPCEAMHVSKVGRLCAQEDTNVHIPRNSELPVHPVDVKEVSPEPAKSCIFDEVDYADDKVDGRDTDVVRDRTIFYSSKQGKNIVFQIDSPTSTGRIKTGLYVWEYRRHGIWIGYQEDCQDFIENAYQQFLKGTGEQRRNVDTIDDRGLSFKVSIDFATWIAKPVGSNSDLVDVRRTREEGSRAAKHDASFRMSGVDLCDRDQKSLMHAWRQDPRADEVQLSDGRIVTGFLELELDKAGCGCELLELCWTTPLSGSVCIPDDLEVDESQVLERGRFFGHQPAIGTLSWHTEDFSLPGHPRATQTIILNFHFPAGVTQNGEHYVERELFCYLPRDAEGLTLLELYIVAFRRRVMFGFDTQLLNGTLGATFNIHIKTSKQRGTEGQGYPDDTYFNRSLGELRENGVTIADLHLRSMIDSPFDSSFAKDGSIDLASQSHLELCICGAVFPSNFSKFCSKCGTKRAEPEPEEDGCVNVASQLQLDVCICGAVFPVDNTKFCRTCGTKRVEPEPEEFHWTCLFCDEINDGSRAECHKCRAKRAKVNELESERARLNEKLVEDANDETKPTQEQAKEINADKAQLNAEMLAEISDETKQAEELETDKSQLNDKTTEDARDETKQAKKQVEELETDKSQLNDEMLEDARDDTKQAKAEVLSHNLKFDEERRDETDEDAPFTKLLDDDDDKASQLIELEGSAKDQAPGPDDSTAEDIQPPRLRRSVTAPEPRQLDHAMKPHSPEDHLLADQDLHDLPHDLGYFESSLLGKQLSRIKEASFELNRTESSPADIGRRRNGSSFSFVRNSRSQPMRLRRSSASGQLARSLSSMARDILSSSSIYKHPETQQCCICYGNFLEHEIHILSACGRRSHSACAECLSKHFEIRISEARVNDLTCPSFGSNDCNAHATEEELRNLLDSDCMAKYKRFLQQQSDPNLRDCPKCGAKSHPREVFAGGKTEIQPEMTCPDCGEGFCFYHSGAHAPGRKACQQYDRQIVKDQRKAMAKLGARDCPKCGVVTEKTSGCNHMSCKCGCEWCWLCGRAIEKGVGLGWHYNPVNPLGCPQFQDPVAQGDHNRVMLMPIARLLGLPGAVVALVIMLVAMTSSALVGACLGLTCGLPLEVFCFCCMGFQSAKDVTGVFAGMGFFAVLGTFGVILFIWFIAWGVISSPLFLLILPCGASVEHFWIVAMSPFSVVLAIMECCEHGEEAAAPGQDRV